MLTLTLGSKAYFDSFNGLIPCRVTDIRGLNGLASTSQTVTVELTANRAAYRRGETVKTSGLHVVPRNAVHVRNGQKRIRPYHLFVGIHSV